MSTFHARNRTRRGGSDTPPSSGRPQCPGHEFSAGRMPGDLDGVPVFTCNRVMWRGYRASVHCIHCHARTWVTLDQWNQERAEGTPDVVSVRHPTDGHQRELWPDPPNEVPEPELTP